MRWLRGMFNELVGCLRQVHTLLKGLEKIAHSADIPMLVAGDFNSVPSSAAYGLIVKKQVDQGHPVCPHCIPKRYTSAVREMTWSALLAATSLVAHCVAVYISLVPNLLFLVCRSSTTTP